ncbi:EamA family transporter [Duganella sp. sic0402]|nr:EamA family transporter [Duganella sp. sic0402]MBV7538851.1 EamA family transporter [Duganella sp. sic0402]
MSGMTTAQFTTRDLLSALLVVVIWGTNFVAMKVGLRSMTPFQLGAARYIFAMLPLIIFIRPPKLPAKWVIAYGLSQGVGQFGFLFLSLKVGMSASLASVILQTQVFFTAIFGFMLLKEHTSRALRGGLALAAVGLGCFAMNFFESGHVSDITPAGFALCLLGAAMWAVSNIVVRGAQKTAPGFDVISFMVWCSAVPIIPFVLLSLAFDDAATRWQWTSAPFTTWIAVAYLGWMSTILGYALWTRLLKRYPVNRVAPFSLGVPVAGITSGMLILGDSINGWQWTGIGLIVAALMCTMFAGRWLDPQ